MENSANYHLFKDGIKPVWEDPANANVSVYEGQIFVVTSFLELKADYQM